MAARPPELFDPPLTTVPPEPVDAPPAPDLPPVLAAPPTLVFALTVLAALVFPVLPPLPDWPPSAPDPPTPLGLLSPVPLDELHAQSRPTARTSQVCKDRMESSFWMANGNRWNREDHFVAFGVWPLIVCPVNQGHTSSGVQVQGHEAEQVLGDVAQEL